MTITATIKHINWRIDGCLANGEYTLAKNAQNKLLDIDVLWGDVSEFLKLATCYCESNDPLTRPCKRCGLLERINRVS